MFDRLTDSSRAALDLARQEAHAPTGECLGAEHILLGLLANDCGAVRIIEQIGIDTCVLRGELLAGIEKSTYAPFSGRHPFRDDALQVLELAMDEAGNGIDHYIGTEHLLAALLRESENEAAKLLVRRGILLHRVREEIRKLPGPDGRNARKR